MRAYGLVNPELSSPVFGYPWAISWSGLGQRQLGILENAGDLVGPKTGWSNTEKQPRVWTIWDPRSTPEPKTLTLQRGHSWILLARYTPL